MTLRTLVLRNKKAAAFFYSYLRVIERLYPDSFVDGRIDFRVEDGAWCVTADSDELYECVAKLFAKHTQRIEHLRSMPASSWWQLDEDM